MGRLEKTQIPERSLQREPLRMHSRKTNSSLENFLSWLGMQQRRHPGINLPLKFHYSELGKQEGSLNILQGHFCYQVTRFSYIIWRGATWRYSKIRQLCPVIVQMVLIISPLSISYRKKGKNTGRWRTDRFFPSETIEQQQALTGEQAGFCEENS